MFRKSFRRGGFRRGGFRRGGFRRRGSSRGNYRGRFKHHGKRIRSYGSSRGGIRL